MNIGVWVFIGFLIGFSLGIAVDRVGLWLRSMGDQHKDSQLPPGPPSEPSSGPLPFGDTGSPLPPFHRLRRPPR